MDIKKISIHEVLTCKEESSVKEIAQKLKENNERRIFVVDNIGKLKGLITTTDLVYKVLCNNTNAKAKDIMTSNVKSVEISDNLERALEVMNDVKSFACPVTEKGKILGIILYPELVSYIYREVQE